ncbi:MAG: hypothetical protein E6127_07210 [Enterobacter sichuanensis]|uniref:hypothetical protein n=1 Tax=Enterobacter cloacae complex TaxID=354276 RepID=UPI0013E2DF37|nr:MULTISPECIES: hypothetical protein [Enterobacter cloacae complex]MBY6356602.1 hypothetical protein [Enterobacter sichuanensis]MDU5193772.1 hypothetical protein [Enterobacter sichuanensis]MDU5346568.1 hypothetical protein [Enterobacter sichuanensis]MDU5387384.1 hypothetical protein [Enterobacter sichuanensis]
MIALSNAEKTAAYYRKAQFFALTKTALKPELALTAVLYGFYLIISKSYLIGFIAKNDN